MLVDVLLLPVSIGDDAYRRQGASRITNMPSGSISRVINRDRNWCPSQNQLHRVSQCCVGLVLFYRDGLIDVQTSSCATPL